eukprot:432385-Ditylum_brightwellii.AAC.1
MDVPIKFVSSLVVLTVVAAVVVVDSYSVVFGNVTLNVASTVEDSIPVDTDAAVGCRRYCISYYSANTLCIHDIPLRLQNLSSQSAL